MGMVHRTARIRLRATRGQRRRIFGLLRAGGDVWAWVLDCNQQLRAWGLASVVGYQALCRELAGVRFGELDVVGARSVLRRYSDAWFAAAARRNQGTRAAFPRRKRALVPIRYYNATFAIEGDRLRIPTARGTPRLQVRLGRPLPYPVASMRSVTILAEAGRLYADLTAQVPCAAAPGDGVAGVDLGIINLYAAATRDQALVVSGRALRAEERLHLADTKARARHMAPKKPQRRGEAGSRRWRKQRRRQRAMEARHRRRIRDAHHQAARHLVDWAVEHRVGTLVVGDLEGIEGRTAGRIQNRRLRAWRRAHLLGVLRDKAEIAGIAITLVDERGTSSTCPECGRRLARAPRGRVFTCNTCAYTGHRDVTGARNIAARGGGITRAPSRVQHRRAGHVPARRDRRRHLHDQHRRRRRSCPAPGRPAQRGESLAGEPSRRRDQSLPGTAHAQPSDEQPARIEQEPPHELRVQPCLKEH